MIHLKCVSRPPRRADNKTLTMLEQIIVIVFSTFFSDWDNASSVVSNLEKYYSKTP